MEEAGEQQSSRMENVSAGRKQTPTGSGRRTRKGKKRGPSRQSLTLGRAKNQEKSLKRKMKRKINIGRRKAGCPSKRKKKGDNVENEAPISVIFC